MIQKKININEITFDRVPYPEELKQSLKNRGVAIAIKVRVTDDGYECVDGHKRLTILEELAKDDDRFGHVACTLVNDFSKAGSAYWGNTQNKH